jgi:hypothetical protein
MSPRAPEAPAMGGAGRIWAPRRPPFLPLRARPHLPESVRAAVGAARADAPRCRHEHARHCLLQLSLNGAHLLKRRAACSGARTRAIGDPGARTAPCGAAEHRMEAV